MTANQLVAYNLRRIRERDNLTQERAAEMLEPLLGRRWSKAVFSAAETSVTSDRTREFTADEILAFSAAFGVPVGWFFMPPDPGEEIAGQPVSTGGAETFDAAGLVHAVAPTQNPLMRERFAALGEDDRNVGLDRISGIVTEAVVKALSAPSRTSAAYILGAYKKKEENDG
jgi:transcriptional regulator with XRE-family HTH domain